MRRFGNTWVKCASRRVENRKRKDKLFSYACGETAGDNVNLHLHYITLLVKITHLKCYHAIHWAPFIFIVSYKEQTAHTPVPGVAQDQNSSCLNKLLLLHLIALVVTTGVKL